MPESWTAMTTSGRPVSARQAISTLMPLTPKSSFALPFTSESVVQKFVLAFFHLSPLQLPAAPLISLGSGMQPAGSPELSHRFGSATKGNSARAGAPRRAGRRAAASNERRFMRKTSWARRTRARVSELLASGPLAGGVECGGEGRSSNPQFGISRADIGEGGRVFDGFSIALGGGLSPLPSDVRRSGPARQVSPGVAGRASRVELRREVTRDDPGSHAHDRDERHPHARDRAGRRPPGRAVPRVPGARVLVAPPAARPRCGRLPGDRAGSAGL